MLLFVMAVAVLVLVMVVAVVVFQSAWKNTVTRDQFVVSASFSLETGWDGLGVLSDAVGVVVGCGCGSVGDGGGGGGIEGSWKNAVIGGQFVGYARLHFSLFGDRVSRTGCVGDAVVVGGGGVCDT